MASLNIIEELEDCNNLFHGFGETDYGPLFLVFDDSENLYYASFPDNAKSELANVKKCWPTANFSENTQKAGEIVNKIFDEHNLDKLSLKLSGTPFQVSVWKALANIKKGSTASYEDVAKAIGNPKAVRAVATAVQKNKIAYLIPCHRVISKTGGISKYKWGSHRKLKLLTHEKAV